MTNREGFTLVELLVVIAIIGILSVMTVISLNVVRAKARDAVRLHDVNQLVKLLEVYRSTNGDLVECAQSEEMLREISGQQIWACSSKDGVQWIQAFVPTYLNEAPLDPFNKKPYLYYLVTDHYTIEDIQPTVPAGQHPSFIFIYKRENGSNIDHCRTNFTAGEYSTICDHDY